MADSRFLEVPLSEIADFRNGKGLSPDFYTDSGQFPVFGSNGEIARTNELLNEDPVVVIGRVGAYCGAVHSSFGPSWVTDNAIIARPKAGTDVRYLYYRLRTLDLRSTAGGSAQPLVTQGGLSAVRTTHAPPDAQRAIAHILGTLDDKIELNCRMNDTLGAMAQALFKSWFVDFDPVRAKAGGRTPGGIGAETARLFPSELVDSDLGPIPKGWQPGRVGGCVTLKRGTTYKGVLVGKAGPALLGLGSIRAGGGFRSDGFKTYGGECPPELMLGPGDLYVSLKGATKDGEMIGSVARVPTTVASGRLTQDTVALQVQDPTWRRYLYRLLLTPEYRTYCANRATGSAVVALSREDFLAYPLVVPQADILVHFDEMAAALDSRAEQCAAENYALEEARDALLPRLLSGAIEIPAAQATLADCQ